MGKLSFCFWSFAVCALFRVWGMTNGLNTDSKNIDPMAMNIDREAFMEQYSIDEADVIHFLNEINKANKTGNGVQLIGESFISAPKKRCEDGPIKKIHQVDPNVLIFPVPRKGTCNGLYCKDYECLAREKKKVCQWGLHYTTKRTTERVLVVFLGLKRVCYETHLQCGCKTCKDFKTPKECNNVTSCPNSQLSTPFQTNCYWVNPIIKFEPFPTVSFKRMITVPFRGRCSCCIPQSCVHPFIFNRATCKCECPPRPKCNESQFYNPDKCQCECKKIIDCEDGHKWNNITCSCDCDLNQECPLPKILDPKTCQCKCPNGSIEDTKTDNCTGNCEQFHESDYCEKIFCEEDPTKLCALINRSCECPKNMSLSSCEEISDPGKCNQTICPGTDLSPPIFCKFYHYVNPSTNRSSCQCDDNKINDGCCVRKPSAPIGTDCSIFNTLGSKQCNSGRDCEWVCHCKNITDAKVCINSTCLAQPNLTCRYSRAGCECPSCCKDHPDKNNAFDCASLHMLGTRRCNRAIDRRTCQWRCECNDIDNEDTCLLSTCANNPRKRCRFDESCFC